MNPCPEWNHQFIILIYHDPSDHGSLNPDLNHPKGTHPLIIIITMIIILIIIIITISVIDVIHSCKLRTTCISSFLHYDDR